MKKDVAIEYILTMQYGLDHVYQDLSTRSNYELILSECLQCCHILMKQVDDVIYLEKEIYIDLFKVVCMKLENIKSKLNNQHLVKSLIYDIVVELEKVKKIVIEYSLDNRYKVVLFPYKYAMWDSMESIWLAANQMPNVECVVVPIPYYSKDSEGNFVELKYEGNLFSEEIPILDWQEFISGELKYDLAITHNVYDEFNRVTSIHPFFYAKNLHNIAKEVAYVPYFCTNKLYDPMHLTLNGYQYCDFIIVQNEFVKEQFLRTPYYNKIIVLGSPKIDCLINYQKNNRIPKKLSHIYGDKKIIFFNVSLSYLLNNKNVAYEILDLVNRLSKFKDIFLVYRPHPLFESTLQSMRPEQLETYQLCKKIVASKDNVLIDNELNLNELIIASSAYIGDANSSIVTLFACLGKPIFILRKENRRKEIIDEAFFDVLVSDNRFLYFSSTLGAICEWNKRENTLEKSLQVNQNKFFIQQLTNMIEDDEFIYFTPFNSQELVILNKKNETIEKVKLSNSLRNNYCCIFKINNSIWLIPLKEQKLTEYNITTHQITYYSEVLDELDINNEEVYSVRAACVVNNKLYITSTTNNNVIIFDTDTKEFEVKQIQSNNQGYWDMLFDGKDIWLCPNVGHEIIRWNIKTNKSVVLANFPMRFEFNKGNKEYFAQLVDVEEEILVFPKKANMIIKIEKATNKISEWQTDLPYQEGSRIDDSHNWESNYYFAKKVGNTICAMTAYDHTLLLFSKDGQIIDKQKFELSLLEIDNHYSQITTPKELHDCYFVENNALSIEKFINDIIDENIREVPNKDQLIGDVMKYINGESGEEIIKYFLEKNNE